MSGAGIKHVEFNIYKDDLTEEVIKEIRGEDNHIFDVVTLFYTLSSMGAIRIDKLLEQLKPFCVYLIVLEMPNENL